MIEKHDLAKTTLETSIDQQLFLLATTAWGECKFDEGFGTGFWEADFDMLKSDANLKLLVKESLKEAIQRHGAYTITSVPFSKQQVYLII
ncbi:hypothetical protein [uncultured Capnocytophaga sp.]|uniref:hypothetical protein n=1 Tax=uncultured Capnocytophaga sp. TaxID=159273 RepID=UPI0026116FC4|nr:hypothetical protein [uncultured Capnocytophaga sp.]